jgi:hypothetical protein
MADRDRGKIRLHEDEPLFGEAIAFTAATTGFNGRIIEKDYFCTVLLEDLARDAASGIVFKGGTCLAKVHAGFYRLSEDLDFTIPMPVDAGRAERRRASVAIKRAVADVGDRLPGFACRSELTGANDSAQYSGVVTYRSVVTGQQETIFVDVSLREPLLRTPGAFPVRTALLDPVGGRPIVPAVEVVCIDPLEAMAEKFRAALSRRDVAIRDFYDIDHAVRRGAFDMAAPEFAALVREKLSIPGNPPVDVSGARLETLRRQVAPKLETVLRERDYRDFDIDRAIALVTDMARRVA